MTEEPKFDSTHRLDYLGVNWKIKYRRTTAVYYCSRNTVHKRGALIAEDFESKDASRDRIFFTLKLPSVHSLAVET